MSPRYQAAIVVVLTVLGIIILIYSEYVAHDCIPHKPCNHSVPKPTAEDSNTEFIDKTIDMVRNNLDYVIWRQSLLVALIAVVPVVYYIRRRVPYILEWLAVTLIIFVISYLSSSWIWAHFFNPNADAIEEALIELRDRLAS